MNDADLARLALAQRAFKATQPGDAEVQTGVRRARLALARTKPRRRWFSKGLVFVVLAVGSLAYAKPQALGELVEKVLPQTTDDARKHLVRGLVNEPVTAALGGRNVEPSRDRALDVAAKRGSARGGVESQDTNATLAAAPSPAASANTVTRAAATAEVSTTPRGDSLAAAAPLAADEPGPKKANAVAARSAGTMSAHSASSANANTNASAALTSESAVSEPAGAVSDWGRVGQALARGDDNAALTALNGLSESDDQRTRDKADLGRAQLLMAHGNPDKACSLARALTHRRAGGRIERQAQLLLKSCAR